MKKSYIYIFVGIIIIIIIGVAIYYFSSRNNTKNQNTQNTSRLATELNSSINSLSDVNQNKEIQNKIEENKIAEEKASQPKEEELSSYSTPLKSKASGRLNNIRITCSRLNGKVVSNGETFSFCNTLGPSTAEKGYQEADVIINGETVQALGGGNCQVSSTLYNVVLAIDGLKVVERHEHGKDVTYVPEGKDAAVSYGSMDFKFTNSTGNDIKMYFSSDDENVTVRIVKLVY